MNLAKAPTGGVGALAKGDQLLHVQSEWPQVQPAAWAQADSPHVQPVDLQQQV